MSNVAYTAASNGQYNTGPDRSIQIVDLTSGETVEFSVDLISFTSSPMIEKVERRVISGGGRRKTRTRPLGWSGEFVYGRIDGTMDAWQAAKEAQQYATGDEPLFDIVETTHNSITGTTDVYRYTSCTLNMTRAGEWNLTADVECAFSFDAMERIQES